MNRRRCEFREVKRLYRNIQYDWSNRAAANRGKMDMERTVKQIKERQEALNIFVKETCDKLEEAGKATAKFLDLCLQSDIKLVSVCRKTEKIPQTKTFPFGVYESVFTLESARSANGCPAIWGVVEKAGISGGAGNTAQHQIKGDTLIEGVYQFSRGKWRKVE